MGRFDRIKQEYLNSLKSVDTEETVDLLFYRPIGYAWACLAKKMGVTPNAITVASIFLGIGAGVTFVSDDLWINVVGMLLLVWANSFDSADGQLARMTRNYSSFGRILDGVSGDLWFISIYVSICLRLSRDGGAFDGCPWLIWAIALLSGVCHAKQAAMADYYRQLHLWFVKGGDRCELNTVSQIDAEYASVPWRGNVWKKMFMFLYRHYTANQEVMTPSMQLMRKRIEVVFGNNVPQDFAAVFRAGSKPLMKYANFLTFNARSFALFAALAVDMPQLYFYFELTVMNAVLVYMMARHERLCRKMMRLI